jgi:hypothetical protein
MPGGGWLCLPFQSRHSGLHGVLKDFIASRDNLTELALEALVRYEFLLEFNSFLAMQSDVSPETAAHIAKFHPKVSLGFWPSFIAFPIEPIFPLAVRLFQDSVNGQREFIASVVFDPNLAGFLVKPGGSEIIAKFLKILARDQARLLHQMGRWRLPLDWPGPLKDGISKADISQVF